MSYGIWESLNVISASQTHLSVHNGYFTLRFTRHSAHIPVVSAGKMVSDKKSWKECVDKPTRCKTSYEWSLFSIIWLYMFRTITSPLSGASSHKLYNALVRSCYQTSLAAATQQLDSSDSTKVPMRYTESSKKMDGICLSRCTWTVRVSTDWNLRTRNCK